MLKYGQYENAEIQPELALFKTMIPARSPYWRELMKYEALNAYDLTKDSTFQDMVQTLRGDSAKLRDIIQKNKGNLILIDVWASWCAPCIMALPAYRRRYRKNMPTGILKLSIVSMDSDKEKWKDIESKYVCNHEDSYCLPDMMKSRFVREFRIGLHSWRYADRPPGHCTAAQGIIARRSCAHSNYRSVASAGLKLIG